MKYISTFIFIILLSFFSLNASDNDEESLMACRFKNKALTTNFENLETRKFYHEKCFHEWWRLDFGGYENFFDRYLGNRIFKYNDYKIMRNHLIGRSDYKILEPIVALWSYAGSVASVDG